MDKRDSWDKINRQKQVLKPDYRHDLQLTPRSRSRDINVEGIIRRAERSVRKEIDTLLGSVTWYGPNRKIVIPPIPGSAFFIDQRGLGGARRRIVISSALSEWLADNEIDKARLANAIRSLLAELEQIKDSRELRQLQERNVPMQFLMWNRAMNEAHQAEGDSRISRAPEKLVPWLLKFRRNESAPRLTDHG
jgi:hypothetical protein